MVTGSNKYSYISQMGAGISVLILNFDGLNKSSEYIISISTFTSTTLSISNNFDQAFSTLFYAPLLRYDKIMLVNPHAYPMWTGSKN